MIVTGCGIEDAGGDDSGMMRTSTLTATAGDSMGSVGGGALGAVGWDTISEFAEEECIRDKRTGEWLHAIPIDLAGVNNTGFVFRAAILGRAGVNVFHIQDQTGVQVELTGCDRDGYMELRLVSFDARSLHRATVLCGDLIDTVFKEFEEWREVSNGGKDMGKGRECHPCG